MRKISVLPPGAKICISKNMALIYDDFRPRPCFYFFEFCIFYAKHWLYAQDVAAKIRSKSRNALKKRRKHVLSQLEVRNFWVILKKGSITACCTYSEYMVARSPLGPLDSVTLGALKQPQSLKFTFIKDIASHSGFFYPFYWLEV